MSAPFRFMTIVVSLLLGAFSAKAETRIALVVANAAYAKAPLGNPKVDAELVRPALERMGFAVKVVTDVDLKTFVISLRDFYDKAKEADIALFYFAGHGFALDSPLGQRNYLMSTSADVMSHYDEVIRSGSIAMDEIVASLSDMAKVSLVFVDACRRNPLVTRGGGRGRGLARLRDVGIESLFVGLSTRYGEVADDGEVGKGSPFARAFAKFMPTPGLRVDDAFRRLRAEVSVETEGNQRPEVRDDLNRPLVLIDARPAPAAEAVAPASEPQIANLGSDAPVTPSSQDTLKTTNANATPNLPQLTIALQSELKRLGCYRGATDGIWGRRSQLAFDEFAKLTSLDSPTTQPEHDPSRYAAILDQLRERQESVCPPRCGAREHIVDGRCQLKTCASGETLGEDGECRASNSAGGSAAGSQVCFSFDGKSFCQ